MEEGAEAIAGAARAAGTAIDGLEASLDPEDFRSVSLDVDMGLAMSTFSWTDYTVSEEVSDFGIRLAAELELNKWFRLGGMGVSLTSVRVRAPMGGVLLGSVEEEMMDEAISRGYRDLGGAYHYTLKAGWGGFVEVGHGARSYSAQLMSPKWDGYETLGAKEGILVFSVGNFSRKGSAWRVSYITTTGMSLLGGEIRL